MNTIFWIVLLTYGSLLLELLVFPVPSVASTHELTGQSRESPLKRLGHGLRALIVGLFFFLPFFLVVIPDLARVSLPITGEPHPGLVLSGLLLIVFGRALSLGTAIVMRRGQKLFRGTEPGVLITGHVFRFSRNPIVIGLLLMYIGLTLIAPHLLLLLGIPVIAVHLHDKVRREEKHLETVYGGAYREYCKQTRRYV